MRIVKRRLDEMNNSDTDNNPEPTKDTPHKLSPYQVLRLTQGIRYVNLAFLFLFVAIAVAVALAYLTDGAISPKLANAFFSIVFIFIFILGFVGLVYSLIGIGSRRANIVLCIIGMFLFPINLIIIAGVLRKATIKLTGAGYKVGLLGVKN